MNALPRPDDHVLVLFGATGDLARRKLLPGLFALAEAGLLPARYRIVGTARRPLEEGAFRELARAAVEEFGHGPPGGEAWQEFAAALRYTPSSADDLSGLRAAVARAEAEIGGEPRRLHYLSVPPTAFSRLVAGLGAAGLAQRARVILEKPFGVDLDSARALNAAVHAVFDESQVFRIDHFLGKESVQNILALRFANGMLEPVWNRNHLDSVQLDVPEDLSIGTRAGFYEGTGAFRDMVVTHLFQVLSFVAMEPPLALTAADLAAEKVKVFGALAPLRPDAVVRGQYDGYRAEQGVAPDSTTETFLAARVEIDNWRWAGVPFFLRTGKRMAARRRTLTLVFRAPPRRMFALSDGHGQDGGDLGPDHLTFELGDPGRVSATLLAKAPGPALTLAPARMELSFPATHVLEAYERLLHDALLGDRTLFTTAAGIERLWEVAAPLLAAPPPLHAYPAGSWGPPAVDDLIAPRRWHLPTDH
jgi:glucose-6-phosphate 1-dehydrogenase